MKELLIERLVSLKNEFSIGQEKLHELERQQLIVKDRLLRISGAIQVLEEVLVEPPPPIDNSDPAIASMHEDGL